MPEIRAYFEKMINAKKTVETLKSKGYKNAYLDINENTSEEYSKEITPPGMWNSSSLARIVLKTPRHIFGNMEKTPLMAADPAVSGYSPNNQILNTHLIVNVESENTEEVKKFIEEMGGKIQ